MESTARPRSPDPARIPSSASTSPAEDATPETPFLPRVPSMSGSRRRRAVSDPTLTSSYYAASGGRKPSFRRDVGRAAAETYLLTRLTLILLRYLGVGYRWITKFLALACYAMFLMPGFLQVAYYYFFSSLVRRSIIYGEQPRNRLDLYLPADMNGPKPVVAFVTGGAWIIGWITKFLALACYAMFLMPGFLQVGYYYLFSNQVRRSVIYGEQPRIRLYLYLPADTNGSKPVVAFVTGRP